MSRKSVVCTLLFLVPACCVAYAQTEPQLTFSSPFRAVYATTYAASAIAVGDDGNIVIAGHYQDCCRMGFWVSKIDPVNSRLLWATNYVPTQTFWNAPLGLVLDRAGNIYVADSTDVPDFSVYFDTTIGSLKGPSDIVIAKFSPDGRALSAMYFGGGGYENLGGLGIDKDDNLYIAGETSSPDFPVLNGLPPQTPGAADLFAAKIAPDGTLVYGTHVPSYIINAFGVNQEGAARLAVANGPIYGLDALGNMREVFNPNNGVLLPFTPSSLVVDDSENCYLTGPNIWNYYPDASNPLNDVWVAKLSATGSVIYQKKVSSNAQDQARGIAVDTQGRAYVTGFTQGSDYPTQSALQNELNGPQDAFITALNADGTSLLYSTYLGGSDNTSQYLKDSGLAITVKGNDAYIAGRTDSRGDFPLAHELESYYSYAGQAFVALLALPDYKLKLLFGPEKAHHAGNTVPLKIAVLDGQDNNISSELLSITPVRLNRIGEATANIIEDSGQSSGDNTFRFDPSLDPSGGYIFNLSTKGFASGSYELALKIGTDAYLYTVPLQLK